MRTADESYTSVDAVLELLAGLNLTALKAAMEAGGTTLRDHINDVIVPFAAADVDAVCQRDFLPHSDAVLWLRGSGRRTLTLPGRYRPITAMRELIVYAALHPWLTLSNFSYVNVMDEEGQAVRANSTKTEYEDCEVIVDCMIPLLTMAPQTHMLAQMATMTPMQLMFLSSQAQNIYLDFDYGWTDPPTAIVQANAHLAAIRVASIAGDQESSGLSSWSLGDESRSWGQVGAGSIAGWLSAYTIGGPHSALANRLLAEARTALAPYVNFGVGGV